MRQLRKTAPAVLIAGALALSAVAAQPTSASNEPRVRLFTTQHHATMTIYGSGEFQWVDFNPAIFLGARDARLEIDVRRRKATEPLTATVKLDGRDRRLPGKLLDGWSGLKNAFTLTWRKPSGDVVSRSKTSWCPNDGQQARLGPKAATETAFTYGCSSHPFTKSQRWGIDRGWARQVLQYGIMAPKAATGNHLNLEVSMRPALARALRVPADQRAVKIDVTIKRVTEDGECCSPVPEPGHDHATNSTSSRAAAPAAPDGDRSGRIGRGLLPDLISLPAFGISTHHEGSRDLLDFAATVYNGGSGPLVAEGFRRGGKELMDAYQFFYRDEKQVASRRVGTMEFDSRESHQHWHFKDFAVYDLVNRDQHRLRTSGKEAFCLAPTDAIDLLHPGSVVNPGNGDLGTACGDVSSVWVREVLAAGWGDTYTQMRAGQSIDITGLPNGPTWIRVTANPEDRLYEASKKNNVSLRKVILGGKPGARTVKVPKFGRIDSEVNVNQGPGPGLRTD